MFQIATTMLYIATAGISMFSFKINDMQKSITEGLFGSRVKSRLIQWLYVAADPKETFTKSELARAAGISIGSMHKPLNDLVANQLVIRFDTKRGHEYQAPFE